MKKPVYLISTALAFGIALALLAGCGAAPTATPTTVAVAPSPAIVVASPTPTKPAVTPTIAFAPTPTVKVVTPTATKPAASPTSGAAAGPAIGDATAGKELYTANCATCHGANGAGGTKVGSATSADLRQPALQPTFKNDPVLLSRAILDGKDEEGQDLDPAMPRFSGKLTQQQVNDIIAYVLTLK